MQCPSYEDISKGMYRELRAVEDDAVHGLLSETLDLFHVLVGGRPRIHVFDSMIKVWKINWSHILLKCIYCDIDC